MGKHKKIITMVAVSVTMIALVFRIRKVRNFVIGLPPSTA